MTRAIVLTSCSAPPCFFPFNILTTVITRITVLIYNSVSMTRVTFYLQLLLKQLLTVTMSRMGAAKAQMRPLSTDIQQLHMWESFHNVEARTTEIGLLVSISILLMPDSNRYGNNW